MVLNEYVDQKVFRTAYRQQGAAKDEQAIDGWFQFDYLLDIAIQEMGDSERSSAGATRTRMREILNYRCECVNGIRYGRYINEGERF